MSLRQILLCCIFLISTVSCQSVTEIETKPVPSPSSMPIQQSIESPAPPDANLDYLAQLASEDLAQRLSISLSQIVLIEAKEVAWPDSSLGCPQPGEFYVQVLTNGYLILFEVNGTTYEYHTDTGEQVVLCENLEFPIIPVKPGEIDDGQPWMPN